MSAKRRVSIFDKLRNNIKAVRRILHRVRSLAPTAPDPDGPFCISIFQKIQRTRHTNYYFANFSIFSGASDVEGVFLFSSPLLSSSVRHLLLNRHKK